MVTAVQNEQAERQQLAAALKAANAKRDAEGPRLARARGAVMAKREQLLEDADRLGQQYVAQGATMDALERDIAKLERALRETADPRIEVLRRSLDDWWDWKRNHHSDSGEDYEGCQLALPRIQRARAELEALLLDGTADVERELQRILDDTGVSTQELKRAIHRQSW